MNGITMDSNLTLQETIIELKKLSERSAKRNAKLDKKIEKMRLLKEQFVRNTLNDIK